jgi:hypothetical protein
MDYYEPSPNVTSAAMHDSINEIVADNIRTAAMHGMQIVDFPTFNRI